MMTALKTFANNIRMARTYEGLVSMSKADLAARGLDRDALVRSYITALGHN